MTEYRILFVVYTILLYCSVKIFKLNKYIEYIVIIYI